MSTYAELSAQIRELMRDWWKSTGWSWLVAIASLELITALLEAPLFRMSTFGAKPPFAPIIALLVLALKAIIYVVWWRAGLQILKRFPHRGYELMPLCLMQGIRPLAVYLIAHLLKLLYLSWAVDETYLLSVPNDFNRRLDMVLTMAIVMAAVLTITIFLRSYRQYWFLRARLLFRETWPAMKAWWKSTGSWLCLLAILLIGATEFGWYLVYDALRKTKEVTQYSQIFSTGVIGELMWLLAATYADKQIKGRISLNATTSGASRLLVVLAQGLPVIPVMYVFNFVKTMAFIVPNHLTPAKINSPTSWGFGIGYGLRLAFTQTVAIVPEMLILLALLVLLPRPRQMWIAFWGSCGSFLLWDYFTTYVWHPADNYNLEMWPWPIAIAIGLLFAGWMVTAMAKGSGWRLPYAAIVIAMLAAPPLQSAIAIYPSSIGNFAFNVLEAIYRALTGVGPWGNHVASSIEHSPLYQTTFGYELFVVSSPIWALLWCSALLVVLLYILGVRGTKVSQPDETLATLPSPT